jgi:hypothetical protein
MLWAERQAAPRTAHVDGTNLIGLSGDGIRWDMVLIARSINDLGLVLARSRLRRLSESRSPPPPLVTVNGIIHHPVVSVGHRRYRFAFVLTQKRLSPSFTTGKR